MKINKIWHLANKMPKNATLAERIRWHKGHARNCACRDSQPMLAKLQAEMKKMKGKRSNNVQYGGIVANTRI